MNGNMFLQGDQTSSLRFEPCTRADLPLILKNPLQLLAEFQKEQTLDLSIVREAIILKAEEEIPDYTRLMVGDRLIGWYHIIESSESLELDDVNILEGWRSMGYGTRLLDRVLEESRIKNKPVTVTVAGDNEGAKRFYRRNGFRFSHKNKEQHLIFTHASHVDK